MADIEVGGRFGRHKANADVLEGRLAGRRTGLPVPRTLMDGIAGPVAGALPLQVLMRHGATGLSVSDDEALDAMAVAFPTLKLVLEPAGAASLAAVLARKTKLDGKTVVLVASGGNVDPSGVQQALART